MPDVDIKCQDCGTTFSFTEGEQQWLSSKFGATYKPPKRCRECRQRRKLEREGQAPQATASAPTTEPATPSNLKRRRRRGAEDEF